MDEASPKGRKGAEPPNEFASAASKAARAVAREAAQALREASAPVGEEAPATAAGPAAKRSSRGGLPTTRAELLGLHQDLRHRRDSLPLLSEERAEAVIELARIEVQIARVERAMDPPLV